MTIYSTVTSDFTKQEYTTADKTINVYTGEESSRERTIVEEKMYSLERMREKTLMRKKDLGGQEQEAERRQRDGEKSADVKWADPLTAPRGENSCGENYAKKPLRLRGE